MADNFPNIPEGKKVVKKNKPDGSTEYVVRNDPFYGSGCWIATAYFGDPNHFAVSQLRDYRSFVIQNSRFGFLMKYLNCVYKFIGKTSFGKWWAEGIQKHFSTRRFVSKIIIKGLIKISKI